MKHFILVFLIQSLAVSTLAQHSPYFYKRKSNDQGIEDIAHANALGKIRFSEKVEGNKIVKIKTGEQKFVCNDRIRAKALFEYAIQYHYNEFCKDPKENKADWDNGALLKTPDTYAEITGKGKNHDVANMVFVMKVDGKEIGSYIYSLQRTWLDRTEFDQSVWYVTEGIRDPTPQQSYKIMARKDEYYPLYYYLRDEGTPGEHKVELYIYPGKVKCTNVTQRAKEPIAKGQFFITVTEKDINDMKEAGGPKNRENFIYFAPHRYDEFEKK